MTGGSDGFPPARSALGLRFALALFGLLFCSATAAHFAVQGRPIPSILLGIVALTAAVDLAVIVRRVHRERRW